MPVAGAQDLSRAGAPSAALRGSPLADRGAGDGASGPEEQLRDSIAKLTQLARACEGLGDAQGALSRFQKAALLAQSLGEQALVGELLVDCAHVFTSVGEYREATRFLERARDIAADRGVEELKGEVYRGFGILYKARGDLGAAAVCFDRALERLEYSSRERSLARALLDLSEVYLRQGRTTQAGHLLRRAEHLSSSEDPALAVRLRLNLGRLAYLAGDREGAVAQYALAAREAAAGGRDFERELACLGLVGLYIESGRLEEAIASLRESVALSVVAFAREPVHAVERARFAVMGKRLIELEVAADARGAPRLLRRALDEAVRLYNAHPLVLTTAVPRYGEVSAHLLAQAPDEQPARTATLAQNAPESRLPNPK